ncbi:hypothetical protein LCGC14_1561720, partial [marine sediment metagenome]
MKKFGLSIFGFLIFLSLNTMAATITIEGMRQFDIDKQVVHFTLNFGGQDYEWSANTPILSGAPLQSWLDSRIDHYKKSTLKGEFRGKHPPGIKL